MAVDVDYYAVLGVARNADAEAIGSAVKKAMREWRKRTEAADLGSRQEAEVKVKQIDQARSVLLNPGKRAAYDQQLSGGVKQAEIPSSSPDSGNGQTWLERAEGYLALADYHSAAYAAREATHVEGQNAKTWWIRSRANAGLGLWQDALYEAKQATALDDNSAEYHFNLGLVHEQMDSYNDAITEYRRAGTCDPSNPVYELAVGGVYASNGRPELALPVVEAVHKKHPADPNANYYLGSVLVDMAEQVPQSKTRDGYIVKSQEEINTMRAFCMRAIGLKIVDAEVRDRSNHVLRYLDAMEKKSFRPPWALLGGMWGGGPMALIGCCAIILFFAPIILVIEGVGNMARSNAGVGFLELIVGLGLGFLWWKLLYVPKWKQNKRGL
ncbi:J domain-containing protein [Microlunatus flavus]|uniref:Tetratricopeptide repeat-containing protein n=1 Tax=Microlunatus flavus TaxID=1036181 RepID=A0A1H9D4X2_9ACTN|nr:DnaJ domain-containing protein [Microlunatus flavus]SEQ08495.1 Tetratricopeptide repeat-containing protein [Microlunatus flavus]